MTFGGIIKFLMEKKEKKKVDAGAPKRPHQIAFHQFMCEKLFLIGSP